MREEKINQYWFVFSSPCERLFVSPLEGTILLCNSLLHSVLGSALRLALVGKV